MIGHEIVAHEIIARRRSEEVIRQSKIGYEESPESRQPGRQRIAIPTIVKGVETVSTIRVIDPSEFDKLDIWDDSKDKITYYQRIRKDPWVGKLVYVLKNGGQCLDPIEVAERLDGTWWIVDGQQRFWAHLEANMPIRAQLHRVQNIEQEAQLFEVFNNRWALNADSKIAGSSGHVSRLLKTVNADQSSPLFGAIGWSGSNHRAPLSATILVKAIHCFLTGRRPSGKIETVLNRADDLYARDPSRVHRLLDLFCLTCNLQPGSHNRILHVVAVAAVARERWAHGGIKMPSVRSQQAIRTFNVDGLKVGRSLTHLPTVQAEIDRRWKS